MPLAALRQAEVVRRGSVAVKWAWRAFLLGCAIYDALVAGLWAHGAFVGLCGGAAGICVAAFLTTFRDR